MYTKLQMEDDIMEDFQDFCLDFGDDSVNHNLDNDSEQASEEVTLIKYTDDPIEIDYSNYT